MADMDKAVLFVLKQEDSTLSGVVTNEGDDLGGRTRFGVAEKFHPGLTSIGFYDTLSTDKALAIAKAIYIKDYGVPLKISEIQDQNIANALLSFGVNQGTFPAVKLFQQALGVDEDGILGPNTLNALNKVSVDEFMSKLFVIEENYYNNIVSRNPTQAKFIAGWMRRVNENCVEYNKGN